MRSAFRYRFDHLSRMTDERGLIEHAYFDTPRHDCGYCTDDSARLLVVTSQERRQRDAAARLRLRALHFVLMATTGDGRVHNRYGHDGEWRWLDEPSTDDWWGRAVGALAVAARHGDPGERKMARWGFERAAQQRAQWPHATAFAVVGAADLLIADPDCTTARSLVADGVGRLTESPGWHEPRLTYANATFAEALLAGGAALGDDDVVELGLEQLAWLAALQTRDDHLSLVGVGGRELGDKAIQFDQQPIEAATLAEAAFRAWTLTRDRHWSDVVLQCAAWFEGRNDVGCVMHNPDTGGGYDGLTPDGPNRNEGAESTLALVSTFQRAQALAAGTVASLADPRHRTRASAAG